MTIPQLDNQSKPVRILSYEDVTWINNACRERNIGYPYDNILQWKADGLSADVPRYDSTRIYDAMGGERIMPTGSSFNYEFINRNFTPPTTPTQVSGLSFPINAHKVWPAAALPAGLSPRLPNDNDLLNKPIDPNFFRRMYRDLCEMNNRFGPVYKYYRAAGESQDRTYGGFYVVANTSYSSFEQDYNRQLTEITGTITGTGGGAIVLQGSTSTATGEFTPSYTATGSSTPPSSPASVDVGAHYRYSPAYSGHRYTEEIAQTHSYIDYYFRLPHSGLDSTALFIPAHLYIILCARLHITLANSSTTDEYWVWAIELTKMTDTSMPDYDSVKWRLTPPFTRDYMRQFLIDRGADFSLSRGYLEFYIPYNWDEPCIFTSGYPYTYDPRDWNWSWSPS